MKECLRIRKYRKNTMFYVDTEEFRRPKQWEVFFRDGDLHTATADFDHDEHIIMRQLKMEDCDHREDCRREVGCACDVHTCDAFKLRVDKKQHAEKAKKFDSEKLRMDLIPVEALNALARVLGFGAEKYEDRNYEKGLKWSRLYGATMRHITSWWNREELDKESGFSHLDHAICCLAMLIELNKTQIPGTDDRPTTEKMEHDVLLKILKDMSSKSTGGVVKSDTVGMFGFYTEKNDQEAVIPLQWVPEDIVRLKRPNHLKGLHWTIEAFNSMKPLHIFAYEEFGQVLSFDGIACEMPAPCGEHTPCKECTKAWERYRKENDQEAVIPLHIKPKALDKEHLLDYCASFGDVSHCIDFECRIAESCKTEYTNND